MLRVGKMKPSQQVTLQSRICRGNPSTRKITRVVFPADLLANVPTNKTKQHTKIHNSIKL